MTKTSQFAQRSPAKTSVLLACAVALASLASCDLGQAQQQDPTGELDDWLANQDTPRGDADPGTAGDSTTPLAGDDGEAVIYCNLEDSGEVCSTSNGTEGLTQCVAGILKCWVCQPGERKTESCGCDSARPGTTREDICQNNGRWHKGSCDACEDPLEVPCGYCGTVGSAGACVGGGECKPGDIAYRRCDTCPEGSTCSATTCVGEKWQCTDGCAWEKLEGCDIRAKVCDGEERKFEQCGGTCGNQMLECDGCFWNRPEACEYEAECTPGTFRKTDCFGSGCQVGVSSSVSCGANCMWEGASRCVGCTAGWHEEWQNCVYRKPGCGKKLIKYLCTVPSSEGSCDIPTGTKSDFSTLTACPPIECYPGMKMGEPCMTVDGLGGMRETVCSNSCEWPSEPGSCTAVTSSCIPGAVKVKDEPCGCSTTYKVTETCRQDGLGWTTDITGKELCPECEAGDSREDGCEINGGCGSEGFVCNSICEWESLSNGSCQQAAGTCINGNTKQGSCGGSCGGGTASYTCMGCRWVQTTACFPSTAPACAPGEERTSTCYDNLQCPTRSDRCGSSCQWVEGTCPPCG